VEVVWELFDTPTYIIECGHTDAAAAPVFTQFPIPLAYNRSESTRNFQQHHVKALRFLYFN
jgi:hypothetical protein